MSAQHDSAQLNREFYAFAELVDTKASSEKLDESFFDLMALDSAVDAAIYHHGRVARAIELSSRPW